MKTPREILFGRHQDAEPKLDAIRHAVVAQHVSRAKLRQSGGSPGFLHHLWQELFHPCRHFWTGLAAVWAVLLIVNLSQHDRAAANFAKYPRQPVMMMTLYSQEKLLNELLADRAQPVVAARPPKFEPKPRSETSGIVTL